MSDALYKKELLRLAADAAGAGRLANPDASATIQNPTCGDRITIDLILDGGRIAALAHHTHACVLTQASAAILGADAAGLDRSEVLALAESVRAMLKGARKPPAPFDSYGVFDGVAAHIARHKCVLLPLEATLEALEILELAKPGA
jgi:NifU-like protein involved in Fe-S cluster formation